MKNYAPLHILKPIGENIWIADGDTIKFMKMPFPTRMTIIRLKSGELFLHSPTEMIPELKQQVSDLGTVRHLVSPNWIHYAYIHEWADAFPDTVSWASPNVEKRAKKAQNPVEFDQQLGEISEPAWRGEIEQMIVGGSDIHQEAVFFHHASKTLILTDLIENFEKDKVGPVFGTVLGLVGVLDPDGKMPRDMRMTFRKGHDELRAAVQKMIDWGPDKIIVAHGRWYTENAVEELKRAFSWLL